MSSEPRAEVFYGYTTTISDPEEVEKYSDIADSIDLHVVQLNEVNDDNKDVIIGKKLKATETPDLEEITASEFLKKITGIAKTEKLIKIEKDLDLEAIEPTLIIAGRIVE